MIEQLKFYVNTNPNINILPYDDKVTIKKMLNNLIDKGVINNLSTLYIFTIFAKNNVSMKQIISNLELQIKNHNNDIQQVITTLETQIRHNNELTKLNYTLNLQLTEIVQDMLKNKK